MSNPNAVKQAWERNVWTGTDKLRVGENERVMRQGFYNPRSFLYYAEFWGDYSLKYPLRGPWRKTLQAAKRDLAKLRKVDP